MRAGRRKSPGTKTGAIKERKQQPNLPSFFAKKQAQSPNLIELEILKLLKLFKRHGASQGLGENWHPSALRYGRGRVLTTGFVDFIEKHGGRK